jgi:hypothetical protein
MKKLFEVDFIEYNGEQEYRYTKLVKADDIDHAEKLMMTWLKNWYDDEDVEEIDNGFEFFAGSLIVKIKGVAHTTKEQFMKKAYHDALII